MNRIELQLIWFYTAFQLQKRSFSVKLKEKRRPQGAMRREFIVIYNFIVILLYILFSKISTLCNPELSFSRGFEFQTAGGGGAPSRGSVGEQVPLLNAGGRVGSLRSPLPPSFLAETRGGE